MPRKAEILELVPEGAEHLLNAIRIQMPPTPDGVAIGLKLLRDLLNTLDSHIDIVASVRPGTDTESLYDIVRRWQMDTTRIKFVTSEVPSLFAQDNARSVRIENGQLALLIPRKNRNLGLNTSRRKLARRFGLPVIRSGLFWDGGNVLYDGNHRLVGAASIARNCIALGKEPDEVMALFKSEFGASVDTLGNVEDALSILQQKPANQSHQLACGQADFHIDLDVFLLGRLPGRSRPVALVASGHVDMSLLDNILDHPALFDGHFLPPGDMKRIYCANLGATMDYRRPHLESYCSTLERLGYECVRVADFRLMPDHNYLGRINMSFNYINVLLCRSVCRSRELAQ